VTGVRLLRLTVIVTIAIAVTAAVFAWRWRATGRPPAPLEPGWEAVVVTIAGADATARLADPFGVAAAADGTWFVADGGVEPRILRISPDRAMRTAAGGVRGFADGDGTEARFDSPSGLAIDPDGVLYVADTANHAIRRIAGSHVTTLAGDGVAGDTDGPGRQARFNGPIGLAIDRHGRVIVADTYNDRIRAISRDGVVTTVAGGAGSGSDDGAADQARFDTPCGVAVDADGNIYVADSGNGTIRRIDSGGTVSTLAWDVDGTSLRPVGIALDPSGTLYITDERGRIVELTPGLRARTVAGTLPGFRDGAGGEARFRRLGGLAVAGGGWFVVADAGNGAMRMVAARSRLPLLLPPSPLFHPAFDRDAFARRPLLWPITPMDGPHEVTGTMGEARGVEGGERFHAGIDVRIEAGTLVRAVRDGTVTSPIATGDFGSLNEWLRIGSINYVHVRAGRTRSAAMVEHDGFIGGFDGEGKLARVRVRRGTRFKAGDVIASGNPFNHVHLNVGWPGEEINPLSLRLLQFEDTVPPTIAAGGIQLYDDTWKPFPRRRRTPPLVSGRVRIVVDAWDQADGNRPNRRLGLYSLGYQILKADGTAVPGFERPRATIEFDRLAVQPDAPTLVYAPGSGIPFYRGRRTRFRYIVTNTFKAGAAAEGFWDTSALFPGTYVIRIHARDVRGNDATANRDLRVVVGPPVTGIESLPAAPPRS
jgi:sugar lactone lactonase YvrE/murein DD-endopeptidase MepM/ murein hydrolase activator NlpD